MAVETLRLAGPDAELEADLHRPKTRPPWPVVVMAHGFGARRSWGLADFADRFAEAGVAALVFDHRFHGTSGGEPRRLIDPSAQRRDWRAAVAHARRLDDIDADRVGLWGTSFSGGHVLATAASEPVDAVVAQVPFVDGPRTVARALANKGPLESARLILRGLADLARARLGLAPLEVPVVSAPGEGGLLDTPDALDGYRDLVPEDETWANRTPARVAVQLAFDRPGARAEDVACPVLVVVAEEDDLLPASATQRLVERLPDARVHRLPAGHFDVYRDPWLAEVADAEAEFLAEKLDVDPATPSSG